MCAIISLIWPKQRAGAAARGAHAARLGALKKCLRGMIPSLGLIFLVLGTIFMGLATPSEAGAMGVVGAIALAFSYGTLTWKLLYQGMATTMRLTAMVVFILIGARVFSLVFQGVGGKEWIEHLLIALPGGQLGFLIFVNVFIFIVAFFLDFFEIAFIIIPLLAPVADKLGIDLIWFGVLVCANIQTSFMHPPFGFALFYLRGIAPRIDQDVRHLLGRGALGVPAGHPRRHPDLLAGLGHLLARQGNRHRSVEGQDRDPDARHAAAARLRPAGEEIDPNRKGPGAMLRGLDRLRAMRAGQVRVRMRIMKLSKPSSATCFQANESLRNGDQAVVHLLEQRVGLRCARRRLRCAAL